jgi:hypothetical protein
MTARSNIENHPIIFDLPLRVVDLSCQRISDWDIISTQFVIERLHGFDCNEKKVKRVDQKCIVAIFSKRQKKVTLLDSVACLQKLLDADNRR